MARTRRNPTYPLDQVKQLVARGRISFSRRGRSYIMNHYDNGDFEEVAKDVFEAITDGCFLKSDELEKRPGTYADVYCGIPYDGIEWYVKFFVNEDGFTNVMVWSMCEDGIVH